MTLMRKSIITLLICVITAACSNPRLSRVPSDGTILAFGDSLTVGVGTDADKSYPSVLSDLSGRRVVNAGVSGEITRDGVARLETLLESESPDLIILLEGGNDILRNIDPAETRSNLDAMIRIARSNGIQLVLIGVPEKSLFSRVAPFYEALAESHDVPLEDRMISKLLKSPEYKSDQIHFNTAGYRVMAERVYEFLEKNGAF